MPLWGNVDTANGMPKFANTTLNVAGPSTALHANSVIGAFIANTSTGVFGVSAAEAAASANGAATSAGWVLVKKGQGGRAGRIQYETLVAMGSMTGDADSVGDGDKDDELFPDS
tara:strand:- start:54 stop:395 length:342 start_codon:yes stop_codon:yes gene_type:complete